MTLPLEPAVPKRSQVHYLWAALVARIYEVFSSVPSPLANLCRTRHHVMNVTRANGRMSNASFCNTISPYTT